MLRLSRCVAALGVVGLGGACSFTAPDLTPAQDSGPTGGDTAVIADALPDTPPGVPCFGTGIGRVCLTTEPTQALVLSGTIDTGVDSQCTAIIDIAGISTCVIAGTTVDLLTSTTYRAIGTRPLVVVAKGLFKIEGMLDAGSARGGTAGAGATTVACDAPGAPEDDSGGGGGGAGGTFAGTGGNGGKGDLNDFTQGGQADGGGAVAGFIPTAVRAGCRGGNGGAGIGAVGTTGLGGGAVYLISTVEIQISGRVAAYGSAGSPGVNRSGGGGGGSGGMIGLDAPSIAISGAVTANGGGGGEGGGFASGAAGSNGTITDLRAAGGETGGFGDDDGGNGGPGSGGAIELGDIGIAHDGGGGGGGGGAGFIYVKGALAVSGTVSPAAEIN